MSFALYSTFITVTLILGCLSLYIMLNRNNDVQMRQVCYALFGCIIYDIGVMECLIGDASSNGLDVLVVGRSVQVLGACLYIISAFSLVNYILNVKMNKWFQPMLFIFDSFFAFACITDYRLHLFYKGYEYIDKGGYGYVEYEYTAIGILYWVFCILGPSAIVAGHMIYRGIVDKELRKKNIFWYIVAFVIVNFVLVGLYLSGVFRMLDLTPVAGTYMLSAMVFFRWRISGDDMISAAALTAMENINTPVITVNQYNELIFANDAAVEIYPELPEFTNKQVTNLIGVDMNMMKPGKREEFTYNGHRYHITMNEILDLDGSFIGHALLYDDVTDMLEMMERIQIEQKRTEEASMAKEQFLANISHEIRTPMNAIIGLSELIIEESRGRKVYDMAVTIRNASNSLLGLVNNVLDFSKLDAGKVELVESEYNIAENMNDMIRLLRMPAAQHGLQLRYSIDESLPAKLIGDDAKIRQVLINIINNGIKFTEHGHVSLDISGAVEEGMARLTFVISDTGIGIKEENLGKIFGDFEQVDKIKNKSVEGSGLGLSISKQYIEMMGGMITVESVYGEGTTFTIRLSQKVADMTSISEMIEAEPEEVKELRMFKAIGMNMLIVDDNKVNILVAKSMAEPYGFSIDTASSGAQALELAESKNYDIILMDHMMPEMDGVETTGHLRDKFSAEGKHPIIIALTANAYGSAREMFLKNGFDDFMSKPIEKDVMYGMMLKYVPEDKREFSEEQWTPAEYNEDELAELWMEGVDVRTAVEARGGGTQAYLELLDLYVAEGEKKVEDMVQYAVAEDIHNYQIIVHGLKSTSLNIGANELSEHAKQHEDAAKSENLDYIRSDYEALAKEYRAILGEGKRVLEKINKKNAEPEQKLERLTKSSLLQEIKNIIDLSESFKSKEAAEAVEKLLRHELDTYSEQVLSEVRMKYKLYDDDGAEELLHKLDVAISERLGEQD